jgi:alkanesulfonate monooxygenase SsuD/methylene tetrahydromethanopterin reductase-like flavin-dependent oxidoreductase (luciferase family)
VRRAIYLAPFGELADPRAVADVALAAEEAGFDGVFVWDHVWRPEHRVDAVGDAWITCAAIAAATHRVRLGPMVVPLSRRRPQRVARESVALDRWSGGRLTLGIGLGVDTDGELARFGEETDERVRGDRLDEALEVLLRLWSGEPVRHRGRHFRADDVRFLPTPSQSPRPPVWGAARGGAPPRPLRRAARLDGLFPVGATPDQLIAMLDVVRDARGSLDGFDVAVPLRDEDPAALEAAGATWLLTALAETATVDDALRAVRDAP